jgi:hypothetical protein
MKKKFINRKSEDMREFLKMAGFTKIRRNKNGTYNATKDKERYFGMYVSGYNKVPEDNDAIVSEPVTMRLWIEDNPIEVFLKEKDDKRK